MEGVKKEKRENMPPVSQQKGDKTFANYGKIDLTFNYHVFKLKDTVGFQPRYKESSSPDSVMLRHTQPACISMLIHMPIFSSPLPLLPSIPSII